jgi:hypothetical protein
VTEAPIEAARHANPLTLLPGNLPITQHIERLLKAGRDVVACYGDPNHFKPFNDLCGPRAVRRTGPARRWCLGRRPPRRDALPPVDHPDQEPAASTAPRR